MAKFSGFRSFNGAKAVEDIYNYLLNSLSLSLKELQTGLNNLRFSENFAGQIIDVVIPAGATVGFPHNLRVIPSERIILRTNSPLIDDSDTPWTDKAVYFRNTGASELSAKIILLR